MTFKSKLILACLACTALLSCGEKETVEPVSNRMRKTVILYMAAENSLSSYTSNDVNEIVSASDDIPADCNFVIYQDRAGWDNTENLPRIYTVTKKEGLKEQCVLEEQNSCDPKVFKQTLQKIVDDYPADNYSLIMWSHGSGWIPQPSKTIGVDNNTNSTSANTGSELDIIDMRAALEELGITWDYIFYDACFMQCVESSYELRNVTDYIIASPAEIPGNGAPYNKIISDLTGETTDEAMQNIVEKYYDAYGTDKGVVMSVVKTKEMDKLLSITKSLIPDFYDKAPSLSTESIQTYGPFHGWTNWRPEYFDMGSTMNVMLDADKYKTWAEQMEKTMLIRRFTPRWISEFTWIYEPVIKDHDHLAVMSIFIPNKKYEDVTQYNEAVKKTDWYINFTK